MSSANRKPAGGHHARRCLLTCGRSSATLLAMPKTLNAVLSGLLLAAATAAAQTRVQPILGFPEQGLDDPAAYQGYQTRFFRDTKGNVVQVYLDARSGRVVNLLADAIDESVGFTVRDGTGKPIRLEWGTPDAMVSQNGDHRTIEYQLIANTPQLIIGWILLGSMRVERDLGYSGRGLEPYDWPTFRLREEEELISNLDRLDPAERQRQIGMLGTGFTADLRARLERDVRGTELLSSREKLMAGLPNYATYFGRDMMMTSLMMQPVWTDAMPEFVIASALRKLGPEGDVSHEEALGGQAIRENAAEYNAHMANYFALRQRSRSAADSALARARAVLSDLQKVRENYHMRDDEFQLPVVVARYLANPAVSAARKRAFLRDTSDGRGQRIGLLLKELSLVATLAAPYARDPNVQNLISSPRLDATHWRSISWRDSNAGYANGRFEMDINAIWAPRALESISEIMTSLKALGFDIGDLVSRAGAADSSLAALARDSTTLQRAIQNWRGAGRHFVVTLSPEEIQTKVGAKLQWLPAGERAYWQRILGATGADKSPLGFMAISLDSAGKPIPVGNTDPATALLLRDARDVSPEAIGVVDRDVRAITRPYPVGLFIDRLGPVVANDAYATPAVWEAFRQDTYHSPRVVWGREVNLILLGLANQIGGASEVASRTGATAGLTAYLDELGSALKKTNDAVEASGLKHNEVWSYQIEGGTLKPIRYGASTDVQLWNVTDLAVQFVLSRLTLP